MNPGPVPADAIDAVLPQTQCGQCGYSGCRPYANAIADGSAAINQCPPGGDETIAELSLLLGRPALPLDTARGVAAAPAMARIDETACIGCTLCIDACPVDAIVGARKLMHTIIAAECTGCALCLPPCPVDCIVLEPTGAPRDHAAQLLAAPRLRERYRAHRQRLHERELQGRGKAALAAAERKKTVIARALARAQERLAGRKS
jgi:electron transport complex protein RnfB